MTDLIMPSACTESRPRARKPHKCDECGAVIPVGQRYFKMTGIWDGEPSTYKFHGACERFRDRYNREVPDCYDEYAPLGCLGEHLCCHSDWDEAGAAWLARWERLRDWMRKRYGRAA